MKFIIYIFSVFLILITTGYSKEVCITNYGKDPVALILSHSMQWVETRRGRCLNTDCKAENRILGISRRLRKESKTYKLNF